MIASAPAGSALAASADIGRTWVMGVLNVTPDSFSDGGSWLEADRAIRHGLAMAGTGADIVDVGGESTRPGAGRVDEAEELRRVIPVVQGLAAAGVPVSIDTVRATVANAALAAGAGMVNDVSGGLADPRLPRLVAEAGVPYVVMHRRGDSGDMQSRAVYADVVAEVVAELRARLDAVLAAGVAPGQVVLDPGIGFAKTAEHNWTLLAALPTLVAIGPPVLVGASRKAFLGQLLGSGTDAPRAVQDREAATTAITTLAAVAGVWGVRVHDVGPNADAVRVVAAVRAAAR